jgi:hypothetical protein
MGNRISPRISGYLTIRNPDPRFHALVSKYGYAAVPSHLSTPFVRVGDKYQIHSTHTDYTIYNIQITVH